MKKRIAIVLMTVILTAMAFVFIACVPSIWQNERLSELRSNVFVGEADGYRVVAVTGIRENPFKIDGISNPNKINFTVITLTPEVFTFGNEYAFKVQINGTEFEGTMTAHPFNQTISAEIAVLADVNELTVQITGASSFSVTLTSVITDEFIDADKAFSIAYDRLSSAISERAASQQYEIFIRLIENPVDASGGFRWYVAFVFEDGTTYAALIDPISMEILASK
ncbi:MAG: hypothetical protein FWE03_04505 [Firmicutes bacterium]|nr:hypothetical protein [Bacillota bacterium]